MVVVQLYLGILHPRLRLVELAEVNLFEVADLIVHVLKILH